jgi:chromosome segregation ATPase
MTSSDFKEIAAALGALGGVASTVIGYFVVRAKSANATELKKIDVSSEWQSQMLTRISGVELELQRERLRGDMLENQLFMARAEAHELQWKFAREQSERVTLSNDVHKLSAENETLRRQNGVLALELHELNAQIRSGHAPLSAPPPRLPKGA